MRLAKTRPTRVAWLFMAASLANAGCSDAGCSELCEKEASCNVELDAANCTASCEALSEGNPDYADAVADRAACIQDLTCDEVFFECRPSGE